MAIMQDWAFGVIHLKIAGRIILYLNGRHAIALRHVLHLLQPRFLNVLDIPRTLDES